MSWGLKTSPDPYQNRAKLTNINGTPWLGFKQIMGYIISILAGYDAGNVEDNQDGPSVSSTEIKRVVLNIGTQYCRAVLGEHCGRRSRTAYVV
jgi:hypothetical protein